MQNDLLKKLDMDFLLILQIIFCIFATLYFLNILSTKTSKKSRRDDKLKSLPGPFSLPLVGHVPIFFKESPHKYLTELGRIYGEIYEIQVGYRRVIVLNSLHAIREAFNDWSFSGRPSFASFAAVNSMAPRFALTTYGHEWKFLRKNSIKALALFATSKNSRLQKIVETALESFHADIAQHLNRPFDHKQALSECVASIIGAVNFGLQFDRNHPLLKTIVQSTEVFGRFVQFGSLLDYVPFGSYFTKRTIDQFVIERRPLLDIVRNHLERHTYSDDVTDMADALHKKSLEATDAEMAKAGVRRERIQDLSSDLFAAGFATTLETFQWCIALVAKYPEVQRKMADELRRHVKPDVCPTLNDAENTPYTEATLLEVFRFTSLIPLSVAHSATTNVALLGYRIPKDAVVISNLWNVHYDETRFPEPYDFDPTRFLNNDGSLNVDMAQNIAPFSVGKRRCVGENLARQELYLILASTINKFVISAVPGESLDVHDAHDGFSRRVKNHRLIFSIRT